MEEPQKRQVARKVKISEIYEGTYVKEEGWLPNYVLTKKGSRISRLNLIAAVVSVEPGSPNNSIIVDDGSGTIALRPFEIMPTLNQIEIGDIINIIGKPRESGTERYILPEIVRKISDTSWVRIRQKELELEEATSPPTKADPAKKDEIIEEEGDTEPLVQENSFQKVYRLIKELDKGDGAPTEEVIRAAKLHNTDEIIGMLLKEGEIFEIRRGSLKALE